MFLWCSCMLYPRKYQQRTSSDEYHPIICPFVSILTFFYMIWKHDLLLSEWSRFLLLSLMQENGSPVSLPFLPIFHFSLCWRQQPESASEKWKWSCSVMSDSATPWTVAYQAPLSMGFSRQEYWSGLPFPSPGDLPDSGMEPRSPSL